ncbi:ENPP6 [Cordylochernes scorpioides]|uniref:glycerophosphocholine cholinephosphodiesterase n=1 Tax=Cordylochernes scorpioides TaxID=51811 RepID=A0ABY6KJ18_9ARAC|nr:ENPP6 [Cordylochernes scorpioides]
MYDPLYDDMFLMAPQESLPHWWQQAEPIWVTAERSGAKVAMFWWDGCQISIRGERPTSCLQYRSSIGAPEIRATLLSSVARLQAGEFQMAMVYVENVDHAGHVYGPNSPERIQAWRELDSAIYDTLESAPSDITVIVLADHGMADRANLTFIEISRAVDANDIKLMLYGGATAGLIPKNGRRDKVYQDLVNARFPGLKFFKKEDIPERYHIKHNRLTPPIVLIADKGYSIMSVSSV